MKRTVAEIAEALSVDEDAARGLVKFLLAHDPPLIRFRGERPSARGKGAHVYEVEPGAGTYTGRLMSFLSGLA